MIIEDSFTRHTGDNSFFLDMNEIADINLIHFLTLGN